MSIQHLVVNVQDAFGWHTPADLLADEKPDLAEKWAAVENRILCRLIDDRVDIPYGHDPLDLMITRVVVIRKSDGGKVCEWPVWPGIRPFPERSIP